MAKDLNGILYIDDEEENRSQMSAALRRKYRVFLAASGKEGVEILKREGNRIKIVITDQRMPEMTGVEFFAQIKDSFPLPIRILLTAFTDSEAIIEAINQGQIYQYIQKPWTSDKHDKILREATKLYDQVAERTEELNHKNMMISLLLKEMHHRIINKLSHLGATVRIQTRKFRGSPAEKAFAELENEIMNLASIHHQLHYADEANEEVNLKKYFEEISRLLREIYFREVPQIQISIDTHETALPQKQAYLMGFIVYEFINNSLKYAFKDIEKPSITIKLEKQSALGYLLEYIDNGVGLPENVCEEDYFQSEPKNSIGLYIVRLICSICGGGFEISKPQRDSSGARFRCAFNFNK